MNTGFVFLLFEFHIHTRYCIKENSSPRCSGMTSNSGGCNIIRQVHWIWLNLRHAYWTDVYIGGGVGREGVMSSSRCGLHVHDGTWMEKEDFHCYAINILQIPNFLNWFWVTASLITGEILSHDYGNGNSMSLHKSE